MFVTWLVIEKGAPYLSQTRLELKENEIIMGRSTDCASASHISFSSLFISRNHCRIVSNGTHSLLFDLASRHGTTVNNKVLLPNTPHILSHGDNITLAKGMVVLRIEQGSQSNETMDFSATQKVSLQNSIQPIMINQEKHECLIYGNNISLTHKEWCCFTLLYKNMNKLVTFTELKEIVWAERKKQGDLSPDVGMDEMNMLLYRLRKKLGKHSNLIKNIRGCGCILELL